MIEFTIQELRMIRKVFGDLSLGMRHYKNETEERKALRKVYGDISTKVQNEIIKRNNYKRPE